MRGHPTITERWWAKFERDPDTGCWLWTAAIDETTGYGRFHIAPGNMGYAHRFSWELLVGPIPDGLDIDHLCRTRRCVNPAHLEPVTRQVNLLRGETLAAAHADHRDCGYVGCRSCRRFQTHPKAA